MVRFRGTGSLYVLIKKVKSFPLSTPTLTDSKLHVKLQYVFILLDDELSYGNKQEYILRLNLGSNREVTIFRQSTKYKGN